mgnify:CR=1 FL=1
MSIEKKLLQVLKQGHSITQMQAYKELNTIRLGALIFNLREKGYPIITERKGVKRYASYRMDMDKYLQMKEEV